MKRKTRITSETKHEIRNSFHVSIDLSLSGQKVERKTSLAKLHPPKPVIGWFGSAASFFRFHVFYRYRKLRFSSFFIKSRSFWFFRNWCTCSKAGSAGFWSVRHDQLNPSSTAVLCDVINVARWWDFNVKIVGCRTCFCVQTLRLFDKLPNENKISKDSKKRVVIFSVGKNWIF
jgi:hypothetical protein